MQKQIIVALTVLVFGGCAPSVYYVKPSDWRSPEKRDSTIQFYSRYIRGWKFYIDPGHGGEDRFNHGPAYDVIEPDINLRVGLVLADYLRKAGGEVVLSREKDTTVTLTDRPKLSNSSGAQIFISVHHNAVGSSQDKFTNFTSVWYHARDSDAVYNACNQDIARYIQRDLAYAMGNPGSPNSFDGTMSDYAIYPNMGFAVLRLAKIPAVLIEGSFFSSEYEEQRLKLEEFNTIEAWGTFKGIGRYLKAGIPQLSMLSDTLTSDWRPTLVFKAFDSTGINNRSVVARIDNREVEASLHPDSGYIYCAPGEDLSNGAHTISLVVRNGNGNASFPFRRPIFVRPPVDSLFVTVTPDRIPPAPGAMAMVDIRAFDRKGNPCADGTEIALSSALGSCLRSVRIAGGEAQTYFFPGTLSGTAAITATAANRSVTATLTLRHTDEKFITGVVRSSSDSTPVAKARIVSVCGQFVPDSSRQPAFTNSDGRYILSGATKDSFCVTITCDGFFGTSEIHSSASEVTALGHFLAPVAGGVLRGKTFVLDARYGGDETGKTAEHHDQIIRTSDVNLAAAKRLQQLLIAAGAAVLQVRKHDIALTVPMRVEYALNAKSGVYIQIDCADTSHRVDVFVDPVVARKQTASSLLWGMAATFHCDTSTARSGSTPLFSAIPYDALTITLPTVSDTIFSEPIAYVADRLAWGIYRGLLKANGYAETSSLSMPAGSVPPYKKVALDNSLTTVSSADGSYIFYGVGGSKGVVRVLDE